MLRGGLAAGLLAPLAGCGSVADLGGGGPDGTTVRFWNLFSGADGAKLSTMIDAVQQEVPGLGIDATVLAWGSPYYTKLAMSSAGGRAPEMAVLHLSRLAGYAPGGLLDPWDLDLLAEFGVTEQDFPAAAWQRAQHDGQLYAVPMDTHPFILFYNRDVAGRAGLLGPDGELLPLTSPEAFLDAGRAMAAATGATGVAYGYQVDTGQALRLFLSFYGQLAGELDLSGDTVGIDRAAAEEVVDFAHRMLDGEIADPTASYPAALSTFNAGRAGMILSGEWELPGFQEAGFPLGATPFPALFGRPRGYADSHSFVLPHQDVVDEDRRRATHRAAAGLLKQTLTWARAGHIPAYKPVLQEPGYAELEPQTSYASAAETAVYDPAAWFTGAGSTFQDQVSQALIRGFSGAASPRAAVDDVVERIDAMLRIPDPEA
ncbi:extracellular solute-binding protein [Kineococcus indalonis]|uniref:extracellular solute-binding protein n=1 Tax=Kineococcus indalonis TaxID=2696566 RepID=UPI0014121736|nr:extracellular solute-binding protein [Kineococcus indalonis]NAZ87247.1 extracellular solute-binding protein [Kineococcus indalonis]